MLKIDLTEFISSNDSSFKYYNGNKSKNVKILPVCENITHYNFSYSKVFP